MWKSLLLFEQYPVYLASAKSQTYNCIVRTAANKVQFTDLIVQFSVADYRKSYRVNTSQIHSRKPVSFRAFFLTFRNTLICNAYVILLWRPEDVKPDIENMRSTKAWEAGAQRRSCVIGAIRSRLLFCFQNSRISGIIIRHFHTFKVGRISSFVR